MSSNSIDRFEQIDRPLDYWTKKIKKSSAGGPEEPLGERQEERNDWKGTLISLYLVCTLLKAA